MLWDITAPAPARHPGLAPTAANRYTAAIMAHARENAAERLVKSAQSTLSIGTGTTTELLFARGFKLDAERCAGEIDKKDFCAKKAKVLDELVTIRKSLFELGTIRKTDLDQSQKDRQDLATSCQ